jgi:hypothetical protein
MLERQAEAPAVCAHATTDRREIKSEFFRREFTAEVDVCRTCGQRLWTPDTQVRFNAWVVQLKQDRRDVFQLQFYIPESARQGLNEALDRFPGIAPSVLIRVMVTVYLSAHIRYPEFKEVLKRVGSRPNYQKYAFGRRRKTSVQFSPMALLDIQSWANILKLAPHKIVEDAVFKLLALQNETDGGLRDFWEKSLLPQIEVILRAV